MVAHNRSYYCCSQALNSTGFGPIVGKSQFRTKFQIVTFMLYRTSIDVQTQGLEHNFDSQMVECTMTSRTQEDSVSMHRVATNLFELNENPIRTQQMT